MCLVKSAKQFTFIFNVIKLRTRQKKKNSEFKGFVFGGGAEFVSAGSPVFHILMTFELTIKIYAGSAGIAALFGGYNLFQITALLYYFGMPY